MDMEMPARYSPENLSYMLRCVERPEIGLLSYSGILPVIGCVQEFPARCVGWPAVDCARDMRSGRHLPQPGH